MGRGRIIRHKKPRAIDLSEGLRVVLGSGEPIREAARRLREQEAAAALVVRAGRPIGILTRELAQSAARFGIDARPVSEFLGSTILSVPAGTGPNGLLRAARGILPGLMVLDDADQVSGIVPRPLIEASGSREGPARPRALARLLRDDLLEALTLAGRRAARQDLPVYLVGGVVRDLLLGRRSNDLDLVVGSRAASFASALRRSLGGRVIRHRAFGTAAVLLPSGRRVDIAAMRRERYETPAALPDVESGTLFDDLLRRDLTINSIAIRVGRQGAGGILDPLGGRRDLAAGVLRVHHALSLIEDPTRAFRIARFAARFGFDLAPETRRSLELALETNAFEALTGERLLKEFGRMACEPDPAAALAWCDRLSILERVGSALRWDAQRRRAVSRLLDGLAGGRFASLSRMPPVTILLLMLLSAGSSSGALEKMVGRLHLTGEMAQRMTALTRRLGRLTSRLTGETRPSRIVRACEEHPPEALAVAWALHSAASRAIEAYLRDHRRVVARTRAEDLTALGLERGPGIGEILRRLRIARLDGLLPDAASERRMSRRLVARFGNASRSEM